MAHQPPVGELASSPAANLHRMAVQRIGLTLSAVPQNAEDLAALDRMADSPDHGKRSFFEVAVAVGARVTTGLWAFFLMLFTQDWDEKTQGVAMALGILRESYPSEGEDRTNRLLDACAAALEALAWAAPDPDAEPADDDVPDLMTLFHSLAGAVEAWGDTDAAYDFAALALDLGPRYGEVTEAVARYALGLAIEADRMHQIAVCSVHLAGAIANAADQDAKRRLEAFDACEVALERIALTEGGIRDLAANRLSHVLRKRTYLQPLLLPLFAFLPPEMRPESYNEMIGGRVWPERVSTYPQRQWVSEMSERPGAHLWEIELEKARMALEPTTRPETAQADWITWTVNHPAYRRAIPHHRSFLREAAFDSQLMVLTHEVTHVMSMIGGLGVSLTALRVAALEAEVSLWSQSGLEGDELNSRVSAAGIATLKEGEAGLLVRTEQELELTLKTRILQDVWTPWFEGLAIFGEIAADPALDAVRIGPVTECLRNLVDFHPSAGKDGVYDNLEAIRAEFEALVAEFEQRCSSAISRRGPSRLAAYVRETRVPYFAGYVAVRGVVAAWRKTTGRPLSGTEVFDLLLHATKHATEQAIPDLSLRADLFAPAAMELMSRWAAGLAGLSAAEIDDFLTPPALDDPGRLYRWEGLHPVRCSYEELASTVGAGPIPQRLKEAFSSLAREEDRDRVPDANPFTVALCAMAERLLREHAKTSSEGYVRIAESLAALGTLLPIGRAGARFFINLDPASPWARIAVTMRTTEAHVSDRQPSLNGLWLPISRDEGQSIAGSFRRLGVPRVDVSRVIDLAGLLFGGSTARGHHVLVFHYGDWFAVHGPSQGVQALLDKDPERKAQVTELLRRRLYPSPVDRAERELMADGKRGAERTRDWIDRSQSWAIEEVPVEVEPWVRHVRVLAERVLTPGEERLSRQFEAGHALVMALFNDSAFAHGVTYEGFERLTEESSHLREDVVQALFHTARGPSQESATATAAAVANSRVRLFAEGEHGWDARPATRG